MSSSKFWGTGESSEEESAEDEKEVATGENEEEEAPEAPQRGVKSTFRLVESSDEDEEKRVVRTAEEKRLRELRESTKKIKNFIKIRDFKALLDGYEDMHRLYQKHASVLGPTPPVCFIRSLCRTEDAVADSHDDKEKKKELAAPIARALNTLHHRLKKLNAPYAEAMKLFREKPIETDDEGEKDEEEEKGEKTVEKEEEEVASDAEKSGSDKETAAPARPSNLSRWILPSATDAKKKGAAEDLSSEDEDGGVKGKNEEDEEKDEELIALSHGTEGTEDVSTVPSKDVVVSQDNFAALLDEVLARRGRRGQDAEASISTLKKLADFARAPQMVVDMLTHVVSFCLDTTVGTVGIPIRRSLWADACLSVLRILDVMDSNPSFVLMSGHPTEGGEDAAARRNEIYVAASLATLIKHLDEEWVKALQNIDPHSSRFLMWLKDETFLLDMEERAMGLYERQKDQTNAAVVGWHLMDHIYFRKQDEYSRFLVHVRGKNEKMVADMRSRWVADRPFGPSSRKSAILIDNLTTLLESFLRSIQCRDHFTRDTLWMKADLALAYHYALHDRYSTARDMISSTALQEGIVSADVSVQVMYNRALVQLGMAAFRGGLIGEALSLLSEICSHARMKELLAQTALLRQGPEKEPTQEAVLRSRLIPYHMQISVEDIEAIHLVCAMLQEVPHMALTRNDPKARPISRAFHRQMDLFSKYPPENAKDHIYAASRAMMEGDWASCMEAMRNVKVFSSSPSVLSMLEQHVKAETLRTYLISFSGCYTTVSVNLLSEMFSLPACRVRSLITRMIDVEELSDAAWMDMNAEVLDLSGSEATRLQCLCQQFADKAADLAGSNASSLGETESEGAEGGASQRSHGAGGYGKRMTSGRGGFHHFKVG